MDKAPGSENEAVTDTPAQRPKRQTTAIDGRLGAEALAELAQELDDQPSVEAAPRGRGDGDHEGSADPAAADQPAETVDAEDRTASEQQS